MDLAKGKNETTAELTRKNCGKCVHSDVCLFKDGLASTLLSRNKFLIRENLVVDTDKVDAIYCAFAEACCYYKLKD